ncbi:hypothetical protein [Burkholderia contaminans]|jgi:hypothetical protein|uniref:hypothetical protein n=1 Tax=Burkholderia contaminans TaxID=488447 RepID=UPI001F146148|nr:hypothetical protein [Burkholderia contaminans]UMY33449.1 hypothetical protein MMB18_38695 [Burkholderia contaminans]
MYKLIIDCGPSPADEPCVQLGNENYQDRSRAECRAYIKVITRALGEPPQGARFIVRACTHGFGNYFEVAVKVEAEEGTPECEAAVRYAFRCDAEAPTRWDDQARRELAAAGFPVPSEEERDEPPTIGTVRQKISAALWAELDTEIMECDSDSHVGEACVRLLNLFERILANSELEPGLRESFTRDALHQCRVWYFG